MSKLNLINESYSRKVYYYWIYFLFCIILFYSGPPHKLTFQFALVLYYKIDLYLIVIEIT